MGELPLPESRWNGNREPIPLRSQLTLRTRGGMDAPFPHFARELRVRKKNCETTDSRKIRGGSKAKTVSQKQQFHERKETLQISSHFYGSRKEREEKERPQNTCFTRSLYLLDASKLSNRARLGFVFLCRANVNHEERGEIGVNVGENMGTVARCRGFKTPDRR